MTGLNLIDGARHIGITYIHGAKPNTWSNLGKRV